MHNNLIIATRLGGANCYYCSQLETSLQRNYWVIAGQYR